MLWQLLRGFYLSRLKNPRELIFTEMTLSVGAVPTPAIESCAEGCTQPAQDGVDRPTEEGRKTSNHPPPAFLYRIKSPSTKGGGEVEKTASDS